MTLISFTLTSERLKRPFYFKTCKSTTSSNLLFGCRYSYSTMTVSFKETLMKWQASLGTIRRAFSGKLLPVDENETLNCPAGLWKFSCGNIPSSLQCVSLLTSRQTALYFIGENVKSEEACIHESALGYFYFLTGW